MFWLDYANRMPFKWHSVLPRCKKTSVNDNGTRRWGNDLKTCPFELPMVLSKGSPQDQYYQQTGTVLIITKLSPSTAACWLLTPTRAVLAGVLWETGSRLQTNCYYTLVWYSARVNGLEGRFVNKVNSIGCLVLCLTNSALGVWYWRGRHWVICMRGPGEMSARIPIMEWGNKRHRLSWSLRPYYQELCRDLTLPPALTFLQSCL